MDGTAVAPTNDGRQHPVFPMIRDGNLLEAVHHAVVSLGGVSLHAVHLQSDLGRGRGVGERAQGFRALRCRVQPSAPLASYWPTFIRSVGLAKKAASAPAVPPATNFL